MKEPLKPSKDSSKESSVISVCGCSHGTSRKTWDDRFEDLLETIVIFGKPALAIATYGVLFKDWSIWSCVWITVVFILAAVIKSKRCGLI